MALEYIVVTARAYCFNGGPITIEHHASEPRPSKAAAVRAGFKMYDSDDFFIGVLRDGRLTHFEDIMGSDHLHGDDFAEIAADIGYEVAP